MARLAVRRISLWVPLSFKRFGIQLTAVAVPSFPGFRTSPVPCRGLGLRIRYLMYSENSPVTQNGWRHGQPSDRLTPCPGFNFSPLFASVDKFDISSALGLC